MDSYYIMVFLWLACYHRLLWHFLWLYFFHRSPFITFYDFPCFLYGGKPRRHLSKSTNISWFWKTSCFFLKKLCFSAYLRNPAIFFAFYGKFDSFGGKKCSISESARSFVFIFSCTWKVKIKKEHAEILRYSSYSKNMAENNEKYACLVRMIRSVRESFCCLTPYSALLFYVAAWWI